MIPLSCACTRRCVGASIVALAALACDDQQDSLGPVRPSLQIGARPAASCPGAGYTALDLGIVPGGEGSAAPSEARGINDKGEVVGATGVADGKQHAFLWTQADGMEDLGLLPGGLVSEALDLNDAGEVVGYSQTDASFAHAFIWSRTTGMRDLGTLAGGEASQAFGINEAHQVTGYSFDVGGKQKAVVWSASGAIQDLGTFPGSFGDIGFGINESGQVAGSSTDPATGALLRGFVWTEDSGFQSVGTLPGGSSSGASALNDLVQVVGLADTAEGVNHAFLWTANDGMRDLGVLPGSASSSAAGINNAGQVVGTSGASGFIWTEAGGMKALPPLPGGASTSAFDINNQEQVVGSGQTADGFFHAVLWNPGSGTPESQVAELTAQVEDLLGSGELREQDASPLLTKLQGALQGLLDGRPETAIQRQLGAFIHQVRALVRSGRLSSSRGEELIGRARCIIES
jgi:probable HAF family extracellular repeat protein